MISGPWNPGFQDSRSALELASFDWYQHVGYESHSVYVKKLDFQHRISTFHHSWKLPGIFWNPGYCLEVTIFWCIGHRFILILNFASKMENVMFLMFSDIIYFKILKLQEISKNIKFFHFWGKIHGIWQKLS